MPNENSPFDYANFKRLFALSQVFGIIAVILVGIWMGGFGEGFGWQDRPDLEFRWHPLLMSSSILFLNGEAIVLYRAFRNSSKRKLKQLHAGIQASVIAIFAVGLKAAWDSHDLNINPKTGKQEPIPNLYSMHSWCGISTAALFILQFVIGLFSFMFPILSESIKQRVLPIHRQTGLLIFILSLISALMGLSERAAWKATCWVQRQEFCAEMLVINLFGATIIAYGCCIILLVSHPSWIRRPSFSANGDEPMIRRSISKVDIYSINTHGMSMNSEHVF